MKMEFLGSGKTALAVNVIIGWPTKVSSSPNEIFMFVLWLYFLPLCHVLALSETITASANGSKWHYFLSDSFKVTLIFKGIRGIV